MRRLDVDNVFDENEEEHPLAVVQSGGAVRWDLPEPAFLRWWRALPEEDRGEFVAVYHGDQALARFVCALDYLTTMEARPQVGATMVEAYAIAANVPHDSEEARQGAMRAWKHDAVQSLMDRLRYRSARQAAARITNRATLLIEEMLREANSPEVALQEKATVVKAALSFMKMVSDEDIQERVDRTRRGMANARKERDRGDVIESFSEEQIALQLSMFKDQIGHEKLKELLGG